MCGEEILPKAPKTVELQAGKGTILTEDGKKVIAAKSGRPIIRKSVNVCHVFVEDIYVHDGDVDLKTGNIRCRVSMLIVNGNVNDSMTVQATELVAINGIVSGAKVIASGNTRIEGNIFNSNLIVGISSKTIQSILDTIDRVEHDLEYVIKLMKILKNQESVINTNIKDDYLCKLIIEKKATELPKAIMELYNMSKDLPEEVANNIIFLNNIFVETHKQSVKKELHEIFRAIFFIREYMNNLKTNRANLVIAGAANSDISATGNVIIRGKGCYNTVIRAGGNVKVLGVLRGSEIHSGGNVLIGEAGTTLGIKTFIETVEKGIVRIRECNEEVIIKIGNRKRRIKSRSNGLLAKLNDNGKLQFYTQKFNFN